MTHTSHIHRLTNTHFANLHTNAVWWGKVKICPSSTSLGDVRLLFKETGFPFNVGFKCPFGHTQSTLIIKQVMNTWGHSRAFQNPPGDSALEKIRQKEVSRDRHIILFRAAAGYEGRSGVNNYSLLRVDMWREEVIVTGEPMDSWFCEWKDYLCGSTQRASICMEEKVILHYQLKKFQLKSTALKMLAAFL